MEAAVWAVGRWADTYLLSEEELSPAMAQSFGPAGNGPLVLAALVQVAGTLLGGQPGEVELHTGVCTRLLSVLVHRRHVTHRLVQLQPWHNLAGRENQHHHHQSEHYLFALVSVMLKLVLLADSLCCRYVPNSM